MKVSELIAELECYDADADVHFAYGAGDYWRTVVAPRVTRTFQSYVIENDYHRTFKLVEDVDELDDDDSKMARHVVVIE